MIALVRGRIIHRDLETVVIDVSGVGYLVHVADVGALAGLGQEVVLHTSLQVREDSMTLYGFPDRSGLELFEVLLGSSGVGPKLGLAALRTLSPTQLRDAIASEDIAVLTEIPGVGRKVAQRMVLELKDRLGAVAAIGDLPAAGRPVGDHRVEAAEALTGLGYQPREVREVLEGLDVDDEASTEEILRAALRRLAAGARP